uniref:Uncharacterized protein n=1 Tax=Proboscia inermis TaxID=420281 RepID=A0A7S0C0T2_9STRA|mmetsp:Transcript_18719/g.18960  ORF Transcript_18719/g.18960 Transcript_18719/m.18960 type:complete len:135 (+) Transcript_18719:78-482(+)
MYMENPTSASTLSKISGSGTSWILGGSSGINLARADVMHQELDEAPEEALMIAERMSLALEGAVLPASESDTVGRVVVVTNTGTNGLPSKSSLVEALGLKTEVDGVVLLAEATIEHKSFAASTGTFCYQMMGML